MLDKLLLNMYSSVNKDFIVIIILIHAVFFLTFVLWSGVSEFPHFYFSICFRHRRVSINTM